MIGQRLRDLREDADMTQSELGKLVSLGKHSISSFELEKSEPNDESKIIFAKHFNVSIDYLLGLTNDPKPIWDNSPSHIQLPKNFPPEAHNEVKDYVNYLSQKYSNRQ